MPLAVGFDARSSGRGGHFLAVIIRALHLQFLRRSITPDLLFGYAVVIAMMILLPSLASAEVAWNGDFEFMTPFGYQQYFSGHGCQQGCQEFVVPPSSPLPANSSDVAVAVEGAMSSPSDGEVVSWKAIKPDGSVNFIYSWTWENALGCWVGSDGQQFCSPVADPTVAVSINSCNVSGAIGSWSLGVYDNNVLQFSLPFTVQHNPAGILGISAPTDNQLIQLLNGNYNFTGPVQFTAASGTGGSISWLNQLHYLTSGGYGGPDPAPVTNNGASFSYPGYQSIGGQVVAAASTTAADGSTVQDCVTFYVDGVQSPSPLDPTSQLVSLYSNGATPHLMTGLATHESGYSQFHYPGDGSPAEPDVFNGIDGLWPYESNGGGQFIGLMMVPTTDTDAWDWTQNTTDGVNSTVYGFVGEKLPTAQNFVDWLTGKKKNTNVPVHQGLQAFSSPSAQLENMALVLYGQQAKGPWTQQFYVPVCPPPGTITVQGKNTWICNGATWYWAYNDPNLSDPGADQNVQAQYIFAAGTTGPVGNRPGLQYVTNSPSDPLFNGSADPWYDSNIQQGVLQQMK